MGGKARPPCCDTAPRIVGHETAREDRGSDGQCRRALGTIPALDWRSRRIPCPSLGSSARLPDSCVCQGRFPWPSTSAPCGPRATRERRGGAFPPVLALVTRNLSHDVTRASPLERVEGLEGWVPEGHGLAALALDLGADGLVVLRLPDLTTGLMLEAKGKAARAP